MHSNYSDGTSSIEDILNEAKSLNLSQISITDHNILTGSIKAKELASINYVIGVELSVGYHNNEVHLLGYFPNGSPTNYKNTQFVINEGETYKKIAILEMIEKLNDMGIDININELSKYSKGIINRVHICMAMVDHGYIESVADGFEKYVGEHCDAYVERKTVSIKEASEAIRIDGGIAVIAHPYEYKQLSSIDNFLNNIMDDIDGIECYHPSATNDDSIHLIDIAKTNNKIITGGSDYHGNNKPNISMNMMKVSDEYKIGA